MKKLLTKIVAALPLTAGLFAFTGCHTAHGAGQDLENAGQGIQNATQ